MTTPQDIKTVLTGDSTFNNLMTGGVYTSDDAEHISASETPAAFNANGELLPCCFVRIENRVGDGPHYTSAILSFSLWFYQYRGVSTMDTAVERAFVLLNRSRLTGGYEFTWADDVMHQRDENLSANLNISRYVKAHVR